MALGAGLGTAIVVTSLFILITPSKKIETKPEKKVEIRILKASQDIPKGVNVTQEMVTYTSVPAENARLDMIVDTDQIANLKTSKEIKSEALLSKSDFLSITPTSIPKGYVAMSLEVNTISGIGWMIKGGDTIDVIGVLRPTESGDKRGNVAKVQLQAVRVLAVEAPKPVKDKQIGTSEKGTVTLLMTPEEAQKMMLVSSAGEYTLALRGAGDEEHYPINPVSVPDVISASKNVVSAPNLSRAVVQKTVNTKRPAVSSGITVVEVK
ncbi:MAG: Flp pilus assembly protein CpaB [Sulfuricurvum sp.]|nr:Flp pilus assembly protein CpaB [Sulfuricurvum sp.]